MIGAIIGAYKPDLEGAGLQKDAGALHEAALEVLTSTNCALQVQLFYALSYGLSSATRIEYNLMSNLSSC